MPAAGQAQPLVSSATLLLLLLLPLLSAFAHQTDGFYPALRQRFNQRSLLTDDNLIERQPSAVHPLTASGDVTKRFNEFVGKRAVHRVFLLPGYSEEATLPEEEILYKRVLTKRNADDNNDSPAAGKQREGGMVVRKRSPILHQIPPPSSTHHHRNNNNKLILFDVLGKPMRAPHNSVGKGIFGRVSWKRATGSALAAADPVKGDSFRAKNVADEAVNKDEEKEKEEDGYQEDGEKGVTRVFPLRRRKRYAEWLGRKRGGPIADQLLRELVNKRISAMMRNRLQNSNNPEFIGRREQEEEEVEEEEESYVPAAVSLKKRYTEFIGK